MKARTQGLYGMGIITRASCLHRIKRRGSTGAEVGVSSFVAITGEVRTRVAVGSRHPHLDSNH